MSMTIKEFKKGDTIPDGSKYIREYERGFGPVHEELVSPGFLFSTYRRWQEHETIYVYEVPA